MCKQLRQMLWELQIQSRLMEYKDFYEWSKEETKRIIYETFYMGKRTLRLFNIHLVLLKFPTENTIQWEAEPDKIPLQVNVPVSIVEIKTEPVYEEVISEVCQCIVNKGNADRRVSQVLTLNYATTANITDFDRCTDMPLEKRMSVKVLHLSYATQLTLNDLDICENCSELIQQDIKLVDVEFRYENVLLENLELKDT